MKNKFSHLEFELQKIGIEFQKQSLSSSWHEIRLLLLQATEPKSSLFDETAPPVYHFRRFDLYHFMT